MRALDKIKVIQIKSTFIKYKFIFIYTNYNLIFIYVDRCIYPEYKNTYVY